MRLYRASGKSSAKQLPVADDRVKSLFDRGGEGLGWEWEIIIANGRRVSSSRSVSANNFDSWRDWIFSEAQSHVVWMYRRTEHPNAGGLLVIEPVIFIYFQFQVETLAWTDAAPISRYCFQWDKNSKQKTRLRSFFEIFHYLRNRCVLLLFLIFCLSTRAE